MKLLNRAAVSKLDWPPGPVEPGIVNRLGVCGDEVMETKKPFLSRFSRDPSMEPQFRMTTGQPEKAEHGAGDIGRQGTIFTAVKAETTDDQ